MNGKIKFSLLSIALAVIACNPSSQQNNNTAPPSAPAETPVVGGDQDAHGCKASAGYQWSELRKECVRLFETGIRLDAKAPDLDTTLSAFVLFKSDTDEKQVELFLPNRKASLLMDKIPVDDDAGRWKFETLTLTQWRGMLTLEGASGKVLYEGPLAR